jgi:hypothetical protein
MSPATHPLVEYVTPQHEPGPTARLRHPASR